MSEDEIEAVNGINQNPTSRELTLIFIIARLDETLIKTEKVVELLADRIFRECNHKCKSTDDIIDLAFDVVENVEEEDD